MPSPSPRGHNMHASGVVAGEHCVLIAGPSGSGKTALALALAAHCRHWGMFGRLLSDDQVLVEPVGGHLIARAPAPIAGLAELRGFGPAPVAHHEAAVVDLVVHLVEPSAAPRMADDKATETILGVELPRLDLAAGGVPAAINAIAGRLRLPPFRAPRDTGRAGRGPRLR